MQANLTELNSTRARATSTQIPLEFNRTKPHERLATDRIGEELAPDAGIWQIYLEEAKEHDDELVNGKNSNLDMMLLFVSTSHVIYT